MKNAMQCAVMLLSVAAVTGTVQATDFAQKVYPGGGQGRVIFDGKLHAAKGLVCDDCHDSPFNTHKKNIITMDDHFEYNKCFACHNGKTEFKDCDRCHDRK